MTAANAVRPERVLIVEDHKLTSQSLAFMLRDQGVDAETWLGADARAALATGAPLPATLVLLDLDLDDGIDGSTLIPGFLDRGCSVIVCSAEATMRLAACLEAGAIGVVPKSSSAAQMIDAVMRGLNGEPVMPAGRRADLLAELRWQRADEQRRQEPFELLTAAERDVLLALADGVSAGAIAATRDVAVRTVRSQIDSILNKLGVRSQLQAVALAAQAGWLNA